MGESETAKTKLLTLRQKLKRVTGGCCFSSSRPRLFCSSGLTPLPMMTRRGPKPRHSRAAAADDAALAYISRSVVDTWSRREYLVVLGIPPRTTKRGEHDATCSGELLAVPRSGDEGERLHRCDARAVRLGRHPSHGYEYSAALLEEAKQWQDVVALPMNEGRVTTKKKICGGGSWGDEAEIGMTRKVYMWFDLALRLFPTARYISKGDDDMFLRVPLFVANLALLPRRGIYMGGHMGLVTFVKMGLPGSTFMVGCATPCRGMWRRRWFRTSRCGAWRTYRTARSVRKSLHCSGFIART
ncbi:hypothetical protein TcBrA4_0054310 [Trypanosoma cruzi]|nr:hypothetical protein TcBrA4_0054310 [Trypanosoma cruzi]